MRARIPWRAFAQRRHVVAEARRHRNRLDRLEAERRGEAGKTRRDLLEHHAVEADEIDLVHRQHDVADAEQAGDDRVAMRLAQQPLARVDQQHRELGVRRAGRHVAGILLMARRVGDDEGAPRRREITIGDIDGDALLALDLQPVEQQGEIDVPAVGAVLLRIAIERGQLIVENQMLLVEQAADQGGLAVVDRAAGEKAQGRTRIEAVRAHGPFGDDGGRRAHQKYPSRFFFSIDPDSS